MRLIRRLPGLHLAVYGCYLLLALLITWPLVTILGSAFAGYSFGDAHEMSRHIWWMKHALQTGQPLFFQPLLGYPDGIEGVILWSDPLQFFPGWLLAFVLPLPAAYNIFILLTLALNGWAAFFLVRKLTGGNIPAFIGGLIFMTAPVMQGHLAGGHGGLMVQWPLPLYAYALLRLRESPTRRTTALAVLFFVLVPLGHTLQLIYALLPITGLFILTMVYQRDWRTFWRVILVGLLGSVLLLVFLLPVMTATLDTGAYTQESGVVDFSADLLGLVTPSFNHPLFGQWDFTRRVLGVNIIEGSAYIGLIPALLAGIAVWKQRAARWWLLLALLAWILSLGPLLKVFNTPLVVDVSGYPSHITLPWALVENLPLFGLARTPGRFTFMITLALAVMAGYGLAALMASQRLRRNSWRWTLAAGLGAVMVWEYQSFWPLPTLPAAIPPAIQALAGRDDLRAVYDLPWDNVLAAKDALYLQTGHEHPLIAGQVTRRTPVSPAKLALLATLNPALLNQAGADVVIVYRQYDPDGGYEAAARERLGAPLYEDDRYAVFVVPQGNEPAAFTAVSTPANTLTNLFAPESGWVNYTVNLDAPRPGLTLALDEQPVHQWTNSGAVSVHLYLPVTPGYHSAALRSAPPCPAQTAAPLICPDLTITAAPGATFIPAALPAPVIFEQGVTLQTAYVPPPADHRLDVALDWRFDQPRTNQDVRFVHVVDSSGVLVTQEDIPLGEHAAGSAWLETVTLPLPETLPPGEYRVYTGWYTFTTPETITGFAVLADVPGAAEGRVLVGQFSVAG